MDRQEVFQYHDRWKRIRLLEIAERRAMTTQERVALFRAILRFAQDARLTSSQKPTLPVTSRWSELKRHYES